jgi:hypothetical protein
MVAWPIAVGPSFVVRQTAKHQEIFLVRFQRIENVRKFEI